jgi:hypothetical protein
MQDLVRRGYLSGSGLLSPEGVFYLNIPKNASTYLTNLLLSNGWQHHTLSNSHHLVQQAVVVLRDPVERWISGFATYCSSWILGPNYGSDHFVEDYNDLTERLVFDNLVFDDHTTPQSQFVDLLPKSTYITYFDLNQHTVKNISQYINSDLNITSVDANVSEDHYDQRQISKFIRSRLTNRPDLIERINEQYANDFNLIDSVQYYNDAR